MDKKTKRNVLLNHQNHTGKLHQCQRIIDRHFPQRRNTITAEISIKHPLENVTL